MSADPERPIIVDESFDAAQLRREFDPDTLLDSMVSTCVAFFLYQHQYRTATIGQTPATIEMTHRRDAFRYQLDSYHFGITHPVDPHAGEQLRQRAHDAEAQLLPILQEHDIQPGVFGNYGVILEKAGEEALRLQLIADLGRANVFEIRLYAGLS